MSDKIKINYHFGLRIRYLSERGINVIQLIANQINAEVWQIFYYLKEGEKSEEIDHILQCIEKYYNHSANNSYYEK